MDDAERLIAGIMQDQLHLQRIFAYDRSHPLFASQLTISQLKILLALWLRGGASGQELARVMGVSLATVTGIVDRLVGQDLVTRAEDPRDRRVRRVTLSPAGEALMKGIVTAGAERHRRLLERLDVAQLRVVQEATTLLVAAAVAELDEECDDPEPY